MMKYGLRSYLLIFLFGVLVFSALQYTPFFPDPYSFYHAKVALLLRERGIFHEFPWLQGTVLKDTYVDHHFFYHILLIPFVRVLDPLVGMKVATVLFGASALTMLYAVLRALPVFRPGFWVLLAMSSTGFLYRLNLAKAPGISILFLLIGIWLLIKYANSHFAPAPRLPPWRYGAGFFILNFLYVWLYAAWPFLLVFTAIWWLIVYIVQRHSHHTVVLAGLSGIFAGLIVNPYFPDNFQFLRWLFFEVGVASRHALINGGREWYPLPFLSFVGKNFLVVCAILLNLILAFISWRRLKGTREEAVLLHRERRHLAWWAASLVMTVALFLATLKSRRNVEYWIPFAIMAAALGMNIGSRILGVSWRLSFQEAFRARGATFVMLVISFWIALALGAAALGRNFVFLWDDLHSGFRLNSYEDTAAWLRENTPAGSTVLLASWDLFPMYFYLNDHNYYLEGLDPTLTVLKDPKLHNAVVKVWKGQAGKETYQLIKNTLRAAYVVVPPGFALERMLAQDRHFKLVYKYQDEKIYQTL